MGQLDSIGVIPNTGSLYLSTEAIEARTVCFKGLPSLYSVGFLEAPLAFTHGMQ